MARAVARGGPVPTSGCPSCGVRRPVIECISANALRDGFEVWCGFCGFFTSRAAALAHFAAGRSRNVLPALAAAVVAPASFSVEDF